MIELNERRFCFDIHEDLLSDFTIDLNSVSLRLGALR